MARNINVDSLRDEIKKELEVYNDGVITAVKKATRSATRTLVAKTKEQRFKRDTGAFRAAISSRTEKETPLMLTMQWYVKAPHYRLTHLLEHGHALQNGGRSIAYNFVGTAVDEVEGDFVEEIEEAIQ